jgi:hypothetical protein
METRDSTETDGEPAAYTGPAIRRSRRLGELVASRPARLPAPLSPVRSAFGDPAHRAILAGWALLASLGGLARAASPGPTSRTWYEELLLAPVVAGAFRGAGLDDDRAAQAADRLAILLDLPRPSEATDAAALLEAWLDRPTVRHAIGWNEWEGAAFVSREGWRELLDWALLLDAVDGIGPDDLATSASVVLDLAEAGEATGYRISQLRGRLAERSESRGRPAGR